MAGEGLGKHPNPEKILQNQKNYDIVSVGDFILDKTIQLGEIPEQKVEEWETQDWFPQEGKSITAEAVPREVEEYTSERYPGGKACNQALAASLAGADTAYLGQTAWNNQELEYMIEGGVCTDLVEYEAGEGNEAYVFLSEEGENRIAAQINNGTDTEYIHNNRETILESEYLLLSNGMPNTTLEQVKEILENGNETPEVILDPSPINGVEEILQSNEIVYSTPNEVEYDILYEGDDLGHQVLQTRAEGVKINGRLITSPQVEKVVDTTAAGDTFNGYLAANLSRGLRLEEAARRAGLAASKSVQEHGAQPSIPEL